MSFSLLMSRMHRLFHKNVPLQLFLAPPAFLLLQVVYLLLFHSCRCLLFFSGESGALLPPGGLSATGPVTINGDPTAERTEEVVGPVKIPAT